MDFIELPTEDVALSSESLIVPLLLFWAWKFPYRNEFWTSFTGPIFSLIWVLTWCTLAQAIFMNFVAPILPDSRIMQLAIIVTFFTALLEVIRMSCQIYDIVGFEFTKRILTERHYTAPIGKYQRIQFDVCHAITVCHFISVMTMLNGMSNDDIETFKIGLIANMAYEVYHSFRLGYEFFVLKTAKKKVFILTMLHHACGLSTTLSVCSMQTLDPRFIQIIYELLLSGLTGVMTITVAPTFRIEDPMHLYVITSILLVRVAFFFKTRFYSVLINLYGLLNDGVFQGSMIYFVGFGAFAITIFNALIGVFMTKKLVKYGKKYVDGELKNL